MDLAPAEVVAKLRNGLIVSCQAADSSPLNQSGVIAAMALAAERQGAAAVRVNSSRNIRAVDRVVSVPIIGIEKRHLDGYPVYITPTYASAQRVCRAGAPILALDATHRKRPKGQSLPELLARVRREFRVALMADVATLDEGSRAAELGFDLIATTLYGYTETSQDGRSPAFGLLKKLVQKIGVPVILEGRVRTPDHLRHAFDLGAYAVVVGTAITGIDWLARRFAEAVPSPSKNASRPVAAAVDDRRLPVSPLRDGIPSRIRLAQSAARNRR